ncbi:MAG: hypothetical protein QXP77_01205 [Candidatus Aenigmatarchaeota archaeon]
MVTIADLIATARDLGIFAFYLPFLLAFAIIYALLRKAKLWGDRKNIDLIVSLIISAFIIGYTPFGLALSTVLVNLFGGTFLTVVTILAILLIFYMLLPLFGVGKEKEVSKKLIAVVLLISIVIGIGILIAYVPQVVPEVRIPGISLPGMPTPVAPGIALSYEDVAIIALVVLTFIVIWYLAKEK